jgi:hypothetical protein
MLFPIDVISEEGVSGCIFEGLGLVWLFFYWCFGGVDFEETFVCFLNML